jgi:hypothetical protein
MKDQRSCCMNGSPIGFHTPLQATKSPFFVNPLFRFDFLILWTIKVSFCVKGTNERISLFDLTTLFWNSICTSTRCSWHPSSKTKVLPNFSYAAFWKRMGGYPPWQVSLFVGHGFPLKRDNKPFLKFHMKKAVLCIYRLILKMLIFGGWRTHFGFTGISRCFGAWYSVHKQIRHGHTSSLISFDRYTLYLVPCGIWNWVVHLGFEKQGTFATQKVTTGNHKVSKNVKCSKAARSP